MSSPMDKGSRRRSAGIPSSSSTVGQSDSIKVLCRFRPPKLVEIQQYGQASRIENFILDAERGTVETITEIERRAYTFDKLFGVDTSQEQIFKEIEVVIESIMDGFNGTVLAYGQTSSGKTHTMEGPSLWDTEMQGVIPRAVDKLFSAIADADIHTSFSVAVSYYEVYNEKVRDLLNPQQDDLKMREYPNKAEGWFIQDVTEVFCTDRESVIRLIETGKTYRATAATLMNADSSRSHSILSVLLGQKNEKSGRNRKGRLFLVDLAGSEKISKTGATGQTKKEAIGINVSLTTLGMVINALCDGSSHVPYRDSKLTLILKNSLGGNSKTTLIICCASESRHTMETVSTLRFGERAKRIKNNARVNEELGLPELKRMLHLAQKEISDLKEMLSSGTTGLITQTLEISNGNDMPSYDLNDQALSSELEDLEDAAGAGEGSDGAEAQLELLRGRINELEEELDIERMKVNAMDEEKAVLSAEITAYKSTIQELEERVLEAKMTNRAAVRPSSVDAREDDSTMDDGPDGTSNSVGSAGLFGAAGGLSLNTLREESMQLKSLLENEINSLEESLNDKEQEARSATMLAAEYAEKYARLKEEFDAQIQRLVLKLSLEQQARADVEDRVEAVSQQLWSAQAPAAGASRTHGGGKGFFGKLFGSESFAAHDNGQSRFSMLLPSLSISRERDLQKRAEHLQIRLSHLSQELESTKEAQRIVLDTKESVMRSLLKQNSQVTQERDVLARRVEDLTATVEQLTSLLRNIQSRKQQKYEASGGSSGSGGQSSGAQSGRFNASADNFSINGGGRSQIK